MTPLLAMSGIQKAFGGAKALRGVDFTLHAGEVHALLGENGAGKSTLMGVLGGVVEPDAGSIVLDGRPVRFRSPRDAQLHGIATVSQELELVPGLDVAGNLFLGREPMRPGGRLDVRQMWRSGREQLRRAGLDIDPRRLVSELSIGQRQLVAIVKALGQAATKVLILDEPTAALTSAEAERLFATVRSLRAQGTSIVYISHRLEEIPRVGDRVTVMRDGIVAGVCAPTAPQGELVRLLIGRAFDELFPPKATQLGAPILSLQHAGFDGVVPAGWQAPTDVSLSVRAGEIVGLAGIMGAGRTELLSALFGSGPPGRWRGSILLNGVRPDLRSVAAARRGGLAYVTDDRRGSGLMLALPVKQNLVMSIIRRITPMFLFSPRLSLRYVREALGQFDIRPRDPGIVVGNLSGGNQQKVVLAKEILSGPRLLLLDEPTRGVDVGAKGEIYARLRALAAQGLGILVASSEMPELVGLCDRVVVMRRGVTVAEFSGALDEHALLECAAATGDGR